MEQLRHRLTNVSPNGQTCRADQNPLKRIDLDDFVACYNSKNRHERKESERFKRFTYEELIKRDKLNLDIFWLKDESLEDSATFPIPTLSPPRLLKISKPRSRSLPKSPLI
jgi:hypothetical protein